MVPAGGDEDAAVFRVQSAGLLILISPRRARALLGDENVAFGASAGFYNVAMVDNVDEACAALRTRGVSFFREPENHPWGIRTAFFKDPDGHMWELNSDVPES